MLAYVLALVIGLGSLALYLAAFFFPEVHRKEDFIWSGIGLFYALVLWVCAGRITGGVLLGQLASVALLGWFGWQTLTLRRELTSPENRTPISPELQAKLNNFSIAELGQTLQQQATNLLKKKQPETQPSQSTPTSVKPPKERKPAYVEPAATVETATVTVIDRTEPTPAPEPMVEEPVADTAEMPESPELLRPNPPTPELVDAAQQATPIETAESNADAPLEEMPPEVELAPPAEPLGDGDPTMRQNLSNAEIEVELASSTEPTSHDNSTIKPSTPEADNPTEGASVPPGNPPMPS